MQLLRNSFLTPFWDILCPFSTVPAYICSHQALPVHAEKICASFIFFKNCLTFVRILWKRFFMRCGFFPLDSTFWNMFIVVLGSLLTRPRTRLLLVLLHSAVCHSEYYYHVYSLFSYVFKSFLFFKKSNFLFLKQYKLDAFRNRSLRQLFRSFLKWLILTCQPRWKLHCTLYSAHSAISSLQVKVTFSFTEWT